MAPRIVCLILLILSSVGPFYISFFFNLTIYSGASSSASIAPGSIATARQSQLWLNPKFKKEILKNQALKKQLLPEDVSKMVLYLASDVSSGCTKQNFTVDAGLI